MTSRFTATINAEGTEYVLTWRSTHPQARSPYRVVIRWMEPVPDGHFPVAFEYEPAPPRDPLQRRRRSPGAATAGDAAAAHGTGHPVLRIVAAPGVKITRDWPDPEAAYTELLGDRVVEVAFGWPEPLLPPAEVLLVRVSRVQSTDEVPPMGVSLSNAGTRGQFRSAPRGMTFSADRQWPGETARPDLPVASARDAIEVYPQPRGIVFYNARDDRTVVVTVPMDNTDESRTGGVQRHWRQRFAYELDATHRPARLTILCTEGVAVTVVENRSMTEQLAVPGPHSFSLAVHDTTYELVPRQGDPMTLPVHQRDHLHELRGYDRQQVIDTVHLIFSLVPFTGDVVDLGDFAMAMTTGRDLTGTPVTNVELALLGACAVLPFL